MTRRTHLCLQVDVLSPDLISPFSALANVFPKRHLVRAAKQKRTLEMYSSSTTIRSPHSSISTDRRAWRGTGTEVVHRRRGGHVPHTCGPQERREGENRSHVPVLAGPPAELFSVGRTPWRLDLAPTSTHQIIPAPRYNSGTHLNPTHSPHGPARHLRTQWRSTQRATHGLTDMRARK